MGKIYPYITIEDSKLIYVECNGNECEPIIPDLRERYKDIKLPRDTQPVDPGLEYHILKIFLQNKKNKTKTLQQLLDQKYDEKLVKPIIERVASLYMKQKHRENLKNILEIENDEII